jgi:DNA-binding GntR family transcriptional regulator
MHIPSHFALSAPTEVATDNESKKPVKTTSSPKLIEDLADRIHSKIVSGEYAPGTRLKQELLAQEFDVSRTPIREALSRLEVRGIVTQAQHRSAIVRVPSSREISEIYQVRAELEGLAAQLSARWITDEQLVELRSAQDAFVVAIKDLKGAAAAKNDPALYAAASQRWLEMNGRFHQTISDSSNNRYLARQIQGVASGYARSVALSSAIGMNSFRLESTVLQHERILKALEEREPAKARRAMIEHILEASEFVIAAFSNLNADD